MKLETIVKEIVDRIECDRLIEDMADRAMRIIDRMDDSQLWDQDNENNSSDMIEHG